MKTIEEALKEAYANYDALGRDPHAAGIVDGLEQSKDLSPQSLNPDLLSERMHLGIVQFEFLKADGNVRKAFGTLKAELLPVRQESDKPKRTVPKSPDNCVYFDLEKKEFRSFKIATLLKVF